MSACETDGRCERGMCVWQRFPVVLCILAHTDEETARRAVPMILTMWRRDTRPPPWNDQYTYKLLRADSAFLVGMMAFGSGTPRWDLFFFFIRAANVVRLCKLQIALPPSSDPTGRP